MDETAAIFIVIMTGMMLFAWLIAMWIKYRAPKAVPASHASGEIEALRRENDKLSERLAVLETIAIDPAHRTAREIESLR